MYFLPISVSALGSKVLDVFQIIFLLWTVWTNIMRNIMKINYKSKYFIVEKLWALPYIILNRLVKIGYICNLW